MQLCIRRGMQLHGWPFAICKYISFCHITANFFVRTRSYQTDKLQFNYCTYLIFRVTQYLYVVRTYIHRRLQYYTTCSVEFATLLQRGRRRARAELSGTF